MAGRTVSKWVRINVDAFDFSAYFAEASALTWAFDAPDFTGWADPAKGYLPNLPNINPGTLSGVFDTTATTGPHVNLNGAGVNRTVSVAIGSLAAPALGDPVYCGQFVQGEYTSPIKSGMVPMSVTFPSWSASGTTLLYSNPWGQVLNWNTARTAVNSSAGTDNSQGLTSTAFGGFMVYHVTAGNGTATIKIQDAATNSDVNFSDLSGATTGSINCAVGQSGIVALGRTATVRRYLRWQIVLGTATTVTFSLSFVRAWW